MPTNEEISQRLFLAAWNRATQYYFSMARDCESILRDFIWSGVNKLGEERGGREELAIALAEANIVAFTTKMMMEALRQRSNVIHEDNFRAAHFALCPIWPFC